jgi:PleD family two-component response regulator
VNCEEYYYLADKAMYAAKHQGKNRVEVASIEGTFKMSPQKK